MRFKYYYTFVSLTLILIINIKAEGDGQDDNTEIITNKARLWWPVGCLVNGLPVSDDTSVHNIEESINTTQAELSDIKFILFSKETSMSDQILILDDITSVWSSKFNPILPTKILVHGWRDNTSNAMVQTVKNGYFAHPDEVTNVIGVDWGMYADSLNYPVVANDYVPKVGFVLAKFIEFLVRKSLVPVSNIQIIGHSLGAQVCGFAGQFLIGFGVGRLPVIVGLDPALPLFQSTSPKKHLDATDAEYVEIIHTAAGCKGFDVQVGTTDFYPNFNRWRHKQPGCGIDPLWQCSHARAYYYFAESLITDCSFLSDKCKGFDELENEKCNRSEGEARMGGFLLEKKNASGIYYLRTNDKSPYSLS